MTYIARNDRTVVGQWWQEVDLTQICLTLGLIILGLAIVFTGSAQEALQEGQSPLALFAKKIAIALVGITVLLGLSMLKPSQVEGLVFLGFVLAIILLLSVFVIGVSKNGATRWIAIPGLPFAPQPTEFAKPAMILMIAWCLSQARVWGFGRAFLAAGASLAAVAGLVMMQPDISQTLFLVALFLGILFLGGLAIEWVFVLTGMAAGGLGLAYLTLDHVRYRIDGFIERTLGQDGNIRDHNDMAQEAFENGGLWGLGIGEGRLKSSIPEAKNDMPLAIIGEEIGLIGGITVSALFLFLWFRTQSRLKDLPSDFQRLAAGGLAFALLAQALINIFYTIGLIPTTGITLPFFSDGGSSLLATSVTVGLLLALTRRRGVMA